MRTPDENELRTRLRGKVGFFRSPEGRKALQASKDAGSPTDKVKEVMTGLASVREEYRQLTEDLKQRARKDNQGVVLRVVRRFRLQKSASPALNRP
jgi:hypothetical protein